MDNQSQVHKDFRGRQSSSRILLHSRITVNKTNISPVQSNISTQGAGLLTHTMPGRVKQHVPTAVRAQGGYRQHLARMAAAESSFPGLTNTAHPSLSKESLIWISILSVIVVASVIIVGILLCRCTCSRKKRAEKKKQREETGHSRHSSLEVTDGRNDHWAWNKKYTPPGPMITGLGITGTDGFELTPLSKAAVKPAGSPFEAAPARPVVVDEEVDPLTPTFARNRPSRYYSGVHNAWKRVSQSIGRAY